MSAHATAAAEALDRICEQVARARAAGGSLRLVGGDTKRFYGRATPGEMLAMTPYSGVIAYEPAELVLTARAGTRLADLETVLHAHRQMLGFEPPCFGAASTIGGVVAAGIAGPRRPFSGSVRDFVLGVRVLDGRGAVLSFGGQVMKNVAGYDISRLMTGALGTLGAILEVSVRLVPVPEVESTVAWECDWAQARARFAELGRWPAPVSGLSFDGRVLRARLSGCAEAVDHARRRLAPDERDGDPGYWRALRDLDLPFFRDAGHLWRVSVPGSAVIPPLPGQWYWDWGGAQRWLASDAPSDRVRDAARAARGHATLFRGSQDGACFTPLSGGLLDIHLRLKQLFDPDGVFNPGRMYPGI